MSSDLNESSAFAPRYGADGLLTAVVVDTERRPLMVAHMNADAVERTLATGEAHFWSRSRQELWHKGATSGNVLDIESIHVDCDQDVLWITAEPRVAPGAAGKGAACHTGRRSCFYRRLDTATGTLSFED